MEENFAEPIHKVELLYFHTRHFDGTLTERAWVNGVRPYNLSLYSVFVYDRDRHSLTSNNYVVTKRLFSGKTDMQYMFGIFIHDVTEKSPVSGSAGVYVYSHIREPLYISFDLEDACVYFNELITR